MSALMLHLLGPPQLERDGRLLHITRRRTLAFTIYLAVTGEAHHREHLTAFFWPDMAAGHARADLRRTIYQVHQALGDDWLIAEGDTLRFRRNGDPWIDVEVFRQLLAACQAHGHAADEVCEQCLPPLAEAVALYRNDFLAGFSLPDSPEFDDWQFFQGEALRGELAAALEQLVRGHADRDDHPAAISYARRWLALDPLHEPAHRWLMQLYAWSDQQAAALRQYAQCAHLLEEELGITPALETELLHRAIKARRLSPLVPAPQTPGEFQAHEDEIRLVTVLSVELAGAMPTPDEAILDDASSDSDMLNKVAEDSAHLLVMAQEASAPFGGQVEQVAGEDILVWFGVSRVHEDDAERGVRTGLAIRQAAQASGLAARIGVSTGMAYCRHSQAMGATVIGPMVNLATRLRNRAGVGQILVNHNAYLPTRGVFAYTPQVLALPGFPGPVRAYQVVRLRRRTQKARGIEGLRAALIGRDEEMAKLRMALDKARRGDGQIVALAGAAGVGKSRLIAELKAGVEGEMGGVGDESQVLSASSHPASWLWLEGRGLEFASSAGYWLFADMLRGYLSTSTGEDEPALARALVATLGDLERQNHLSPTALEEIGPLLGRLLAVRFGSAWDEQLRYISPEQIHYRLTRAVVDFVAALTCRQPVALIFEDLHWADTPSLDLIVSLLDLLPAHRLLLLCVYRPEQAQADGHLATLAQHKCPERFTTLHLSELTADESRQMVASLLAIERLPEVTRSQLLDKAQGNPFFLEEIVRSLIDGGYLYRQGDTWRAREDVSVTTVPESLQSLILSRADRLDEGPQRVLQMASVLGRLFQPRVLAAMATGKLDLEAALARLRAQSFIYLERRLPEAEYSFQHVLLRDAIYQALPRARRSELHRQAAQALESLFADNREPVIEQLAYHYEQSEVEEKAIEYLLLAGQKAQRTYSNDEALAYFRRAQGYVNQNRAAAPGQQLAVLDGIGQVYATLGDFQQGEPCLRQAIALAQALALPPVEQVQRYFPLCHLLDWHGQDDDMLALADDGLALLGGDLTQPEAVMLVTLKSEVFFNRGQHRSAMALIAQVIEVLPEMGYVPHLQSAYNMVAMWCRYTKQVGQGFELLAEIEEKALAQQDLWTVGYLHRWPVMFLYETIGDLKEVFKSLRKVEEIVTQTGDELLKIQVCIFRGVVHGWCEGNLELGATYAQEAIRLTEQADVPRNKSVFGYVTLGLAYYSRHAWADAATTLEFARQMALAQRFRPDGARRCDIGLAWSYLQLGRKDEAAALFHSVVAEEEVDMESLHLITCALAGLAVACPDPRRFQEQCKQIEAERAGVGALRLVQWSQKPAEPARQFMTLDAELPKAELEFRQQGWQWHDPFGDCTYSLDNGVVIQAANYRDLWLNNLGAPRLLRAVSGAFALEASCTTALADRLAMGGLLLWKDQANYLRLTWNTHGPGEINLLGCVKNRDVLLGRGVLPHAEQTYLRLERVNTCVRGLFSADGRVWYSVGTVEFPVKDPVDVGLLAVGFIPRYVYAGGYMAETAIRFASLQLWRGRASRVHSISP